MPFSVKVRSKPPLECGEPQLDVEVPWWSSGVLRDDPRFTETWSNGYRDFDAIVSAAELRSLHEQFKRSAFEGVFAYSGWRERVEPLLYELERVLACAPSTRRFHIHVFEWESGLD